MSPNDVIAAVSPWHQAAAHDALVILALIVGVPVLVAVTVAAIAWGIRSFQRRRQRIDAQLRASAALEARARDMMSELCPHGWRAQLILFGSSEELPADAPRGERARVALDWAELDDESGHVAVVRRVWAPTIAEALDAMVSDRRTDETLEQIERTVRLWPD